MNPKLRQELVVGADAWMMLMRLLPELSVGQRLPLALRAFGWSVERAPNDSPSECRHLAMSFYYLSGVLQRLEGVPILRTEHLTLLLEEDYFPAEWFDGCVQGEFDLWAAGVGAVPQALWLDWEVESLALDTENRRARRSEENHRICPGQKLPLIRRLVEREAIAEFAQPRRSTSAFEDDHGHAHYRVGIRRATF
jgi:hypothetical protein